jgi:hypothetical protein
LFVFEFFGWEDTPIILRARLDTTSILRPQLDTTIILRARLHVG